MPKAVIRIRKEPAYRRDAFVSGLLRVGYEIADGSKSNDEWRPAGKADLLVLWNRKAGMEERMAETWEARGGTVLVAENAYLQKVDKSMYALSTHDHNGAGWFPKGGEDRFSALGFELKPRLMGETGRILLVGQRSIGSKRMASPPQWAEKQLEKLGRAAAFVRPHPGNFVSKVSLDADFARCCSVYTWASSVGVRALVEGLYVNCFAPDWICHPTGRTREAALHHMAFGQWTVDEIASGEPFARMAAEDWGPSTWR